MNDTLATMSLFEKMIQKMKKLSKVKNTFFDFVAQNSENTSLKFVYNSILNTQSISIDDEEFLKVFLKALPKNNKVAKRAINSELDF